MKVDYYDGEAGCVYTTWGRVVDSTYAQECRKLGREALDNTGKVRGKRKAANAEKGAKRNGGLEA
jgi:hypothetical protein